jgi:uncharacterized membrane protein YgcG
MAGRCHMLQNNITVCYILYYYITYCVLCINPPPHTHTYIWQVGQFRACVRAYEGKIRGQLEGMGHGGVGGMGFGGGNSSGSGGGVYSNGTVSTWFRASQMCAHDRHTFGLGIYS